MWILKHSNLTWDEAQQALKDGFFIGQSIWHHGTVSGPVRICLDKNWNLLTRPIPIVMELGVRYSVGRWIPSPQELDSNEWLAFEWQDD